MEQKGFLIKEGNKIKINHKKTDSVILNRIQVAFLLKNKDKLKGKLLDAGCGEKPYSLIYGDSVTEVIGCDVETCIHNQQEVDVFASLDDLPFEDEEFDTILCTNVIEHVEHAERAYSELSRVLKKGGTLIVSMPFLYPVHEAPYDFQRFTKFGLEYKLRLNRMKLQVLYPWGGPGLLFVVYFNLFICKCIKLGWMKKINCCLQEIFYAIYSKTSYSKVIQGKCKLGETISLGYFGVATKE